MLDPSASRTKPKRATAARKVPAQSALFMSRISARAALADAADRALAVDRADLNGLALEAISVARRRGDEKSLRELETVVRRVLDRHWEPLEDEHGEAEPSRVLRFKEASKLLALAVRCDRAVDADNVLTDIIDQIAHAQTVLERHPDVWPARSDANPLREMADAMCAAASRGRSLVRAAVEGWTGDLDLSTRTRRAADEK